MGGEEAPALLWALRPFIVGGLAGMTATSCVQPLDFIKTRAQLLGEGSRIERPSSPLVFARAVIKEQGLRGLYRGYSAALARQLIYGSCRLGLFRLFSDELLRRKGRPTLSLAEKVTAGVSSGAIAAIVGNPTEVALIRMQADSSLPAAARRNYKGVINAVTRVVREEGVFELWRGCLPTVLRAIAMNASMLATNDEVKQQLAPHLGAGAASSAISSICAGVVSSVASLPFDMIKTRLQKQTPLPSGAMPYRGFFDCARKIARTEGALAFYKGLPTYIARILPHSIITLMLVDFLNAATQRFAPAAPL